jgi:hypothetical protein
MMISLTDKYYQIVLAQGVGVGVRILCIYVCYRTLGNANPGNHRSSVSEYSSSPLSPLWAIGSVGEERWRWVSLPVGARAAVSCYPVRPPLFSVIYGESNERRGSLT